MQLSVWLLTSVSMVGCLFLFSLLFFCFLLLLRTLHPSQVHENDVGVHACVRAPLNWFKAVLYCVFMYKLRKPNKQKLYNLIWARSNLFWPKACEVLKYGLISEQKWIKRKQTTDQTNKTNEIPKTDRERESEREKITLRKAVREILFRSNLMDHF